MDDVGDAEPTDRGPSQTPGERDDSTTPAGAPVPLEESSRRVELVETTARNLLPDGREETTSSTRIDETVRRSAVPYQAPGSAYPAPVG